ncbi:MAG: hypothetical protein ACI3ZR_05815, partial [bacterium]
NYFAPIVNALVNPIFRKETFRDWSGKEEVELFLNDIDCAGSDIQAFMQKAALKAKLYGAVFIVVDNFRDLPDNMGEVLSSRRLPYAYLVEPPAVESYKLDRAGKLLEITFKDIVSSGTNGVKERKITYNTELWQIEEDGRQENIGEHGLHRVPVILFTSGDWENFNISGEFEALAGIAKNLYNVCSWLTEILKNQTFSVMTYPAAEAKNLEIGTNNALAYDGVECRHAPSFIAPPAEPASILLNQMNFLVQEMYRIAGLSFVTGTKQEASGVAKAWEFERTNQALAELAGRCQLAEKQILELFGLWQKRPVKYEVGYPKDFGIVDVKTELEKAQQVLDMGFNSKVSLEVLKQVLNVYVPDLPPEDFDQIIQEQEKQKEDQTHSEEQLNDSSGAD